VTPQCSTIEKCRGQRRTSLVIPFYCYRKGVRAGAASLPALGRCALPLLQPGRCARRLLLPPPPPLLLLGACRLLGRGLPCAGRLPLLLLLRCSLVGRAPRAFDRALSTPPEPPPAPAPAVVARPTPAAGAVAGTSAACRPTLRLWLPGALRGCRLPPPTSLLGLGLGLGLTLGRGDADTDTASCCLDCRLLACGCWVLLGCTWKGEATMAALSSSTATSSSSVILRRHRHSPRQLFWR